MKRRTKTVEKRTFTLKNAIPMFVSLVGRGANFTPLAELRFSDKEKFTEVEINRIEFSKDTFDKSGVEQYLQDNDYVDFSIEENETSFVIPGVDSDQFSEISEVEYNDGIKFYIGKLKEEIADNQPTADVVDSDSLDFGASIEAIEEVESSENLEEEVEEIVNEETVSESQESASEDGAEEQSSGEAAAEASPEEKEEIEAAFAHAQVAASNLLTTEKYSGGFASFRDQFDEFRERGMPLSYDTLQYIFSDANYYALMENDQDQFRKNCNDYYSAVVALINAQKNLNYNEPEIIETEDFNMTKEEVTELIQELLDAKFAEKEQETVEEVENTIDEQELVVQNSQAVNVEEILTDKKIDEKTAKFLQRKNADLFGIRD